MYFCLLNTKSREIDFIMGDTKVKAGKERDGEIVAKYGQGSCNKRGVKLIQWETANDHIINDRWFQEHLRRLWVGKSLE